MKSLGIFIFLFCVVFDNLSAAEPGVTATKHTLVVGIKQAPPFAIKQDNGDWSGMSVDLWRNLAAELKLDFKFKESDLAGLLNGVTNKELDAAVGAITVTSERISKMDFSHPFHSSGLSIAIAAHDKNAWLGVLNSFFTWQFLSVVSTLLLLLLVIGFLAWFFEHKRNQQFGGSPLQGIGSGLWWSAVTMTTVGYGDKSPITLGGRLIALIWMFASIIVISGITAAIASSLTVGQLNTAISGPQDLYTTRTGTVAGSSSEAYLQSHYIGSLPYQGIDEGLQALKAGEIDAFVYDKPLLRYFAKTKFQGEIEVIPNTFQRQDYAFALPKNSKLKKQIDQHLLKQLESNNWQEQLVRYLGVESGF